MGTTSLGIVYPESTANTQLWTHFQTMAEDVDDAIQDTIDYRDGAWSTYTPTMAGATSGGTIGNASVTSRYKLLGAKTCYVNQLIIWGSTTSAGTGAITLTLPFTARSTSPAYIGTMWAIDVSPTARVPCGIALDTTSRVAFVRMSTGSFVDATSAFTWTTSDQMHLAYTYELA